MDSRPSIGCLNAREAGIEDVEFVKGNIEDIALDDDSVDVVISNCIEIRDTHRVHEHAGAAIVRARKPKQD